MEQSLKNEEIKRLPILLGSSTYRDRKEGFKFLSSLLIENEDHSEAFIKGIIQLLISLIPLYIDRRSRHSLLTLFDTLAEKFGASSKNHLVNYYAYQAQDHVNYLNSNKNLGRYYVFPLEIGCHIWSKLSKAGFNLSEKQGNVMGEAISTYFALSINNDCKKLVQRVLTNLDLVWKNEDDLVLFCKTFVADDMSVHKVILGGWLLKHLLEKKTAYDFSSLKTSLIQNYVRIVLQTKKKPSQFVLQRSSVLLKQLNHGEFSEIILPVAQKNILRNPEVVLEAVSYLFSAVNIDLSRYVEQICKVLQSPLHAKEDLVRDETVTLCHELIKQCTEVEAVKSFVVFLFDLFNGSDGKLTVTAHRISVLQALEKASYHCVSGNSAYNLSEDVSLRVTKVLETETQEMAIVQAITCLVAWAHQRFRTEMPVKILEFIPKAINFKSSTSLIRSSYFRYLLSCINPALTPMYVTLIPSLIQAAEKAISQPSQIYMVTESLSACTLLLKIVSYDMSLCPKIEMLWKTALDLKKNIFSGEKYLRNAPVEGLQQLLKMSELLLLHYSDKLGENAPAVHFSILWCLCCSYSAVRQMARSVVISLCQKDHDLVLLLLVVLGEMVEKFNLQVVDREDEASDSPKDLSCLGVIKGLLAICATKNLSKVTRQKVALHTLKITYQIPTLSENGNLWCLICKSLGLPPDVVMEKQKVTIKNMILTDFKITDANKKLAAGVCRYGSKSNFPWLIPFIEENLDEPAFLDVTDEDLEIFNTPEGVLFNQKAVDDAYEMDLNTKNMKKQSKAYSHKEQLIMIEEKRKEIEKKRKQGRLELTQKQKDIMAKELDKEKGIRNRVQNLDNKASVPLCLLEAACEGSLDELSHHFKTLVPLLVKYIPSKLVGEKMSWIFYRFREIFDGDNIIFGSTLGRVVLLTHDANIKVPVDWQGEDSSKACVRVVHQLFLMTDTEKDDEPNYLSAPAFVYSYPLLEYVLQKGTFLLEQDKDKVALWCLGIIKCHVSMRGTYEDSEYHPRFLPRELLLKLIIDMISTRDGRVQQMACAILADVCVCASGLPGCDRVTRSEIYILLNTLTAPAQSVRDASLRGLTVLIDSLSNLSLDSESMNMMIHRLYVAKHDEDEDIQSIATNLWEKAGMKCNPKLLDLIISDVSHPTAAVRSSASKALASFASTDPKSVDDITKRLIEVYKKLLELTPAKKDKYDHVISEAIDHWEGRSGVALSLHCLAPLLEEKSVVALTKFFVPESLGDRDERVRTHMLEAAMAVVNTHGKATVNNLLPVFEKFLKSAPNAAKFDAIRQSVVILMGSLAKHLDSTSPKIKPIVAKLIDALSTPSQPVQESVASCLYPLVPAIKEDCPKLVTKLMKILLESSNYGQRKGAAYGLASLVKGLGILSLKQLDIMNQLTVAIQDQKVYRYREGALIALEQLCNMLGKLFEPYIVHVLPHLLLCFGDGNTYVRQAADDTAKAVMSKLSAHGVKLVLPSLLAALEEDSWRTKTGSIDLLGNMAFCAPKQLSSCLPSIVPRLIEVLSDSHQKVQTAAAEALKLIGSVIRNPEIQAIVPVMLDALQDSSKNTSVCLQTLLETKFVHFIDAPSLALIMPVVQRAFQDRSTEVRKMSAQIIGNMYSLTDQKDLAPYLPNIIPGLKASLLDPVPKVRSVSARALGAMVRGMGETAFDDLLPWLMVTLTSEASPVDRSGAAQGLAEVVGGLGPEKLHRLMPDIVATAERNDIAPHVKDGYIMMFIFLPTVFEDEFTAYIGQIIPPILKALADENEFVRDTALRAGQRIVNTYASTAVTLLLPELENGLFHDNWRIRFSSVQLLGDLLYRVSGVSGKMTTDTAHEDDNFGTESSQKALISVLGVERRNRVLAGLYMGRSDVALMVRQAALHVWKVVVTNTPKTLREILPTLFSLLLSCLASTSYDKRQVAARTLGDLVRKLGERVLPEIIPILENGLQSEDPDHRQGVCIGLSEIMASTSRDMVLSFADNLVPTVRKALCDPLPAVREAAARTFDALHSTIGIRALDDILPELLSQLENKLPNGTDDNDSTDQAEWALDGLKQVMGVKGRVVLPYLIPQLTATPVNTQALSILSAVAGETLTKHLQKILPALLAALSETASTPDYNVALTHCQEVILAVQDDTGVNTIVDELLTYSKNNDMGTARAAVALLLSFCSTTNADYTDHAPQLVRGLIALFMSKDEVVLQSAWGALGAVTKNLDAVNQRMLVSDVRQAVKFAALDLKGEVLIPGFCLPKGIQPVLPIFREAILNGEPDHKEAAANGLTEVIRLTSSDALKTSVVHITGPLIRILGDRFAWNVKVAVLDTLALLLQKAGALLKPFLPQLQTTFVKAVHDPHRGVRLKAGNALSHLITIHTKPDPLFTELHNSLRTADDALLRETLLQAVRSVVTPCGSRMSEAVSDSLLNTLTSLLYHEVENIRMGAGGALGAHLRWVSDSKAKKTFSEYVLDDNPNLDWSVRHGKSVALFSALKSCPEQLLKVSNETKLINVLLSYLSSDRVALVENGVIGVGFLLKYKLPIGQSIPANLLTAFAKSVNNNSNEVKQSMCRSCQYVSEAVASKDSRKTVPADVVKVVLPMLVNASKEKNMIVRSAAEMALIAMLKMKDGVSQAQELINIFDGGARDSLMDVLNKNLRKVSSYVAVTEAEMDPTLLT